MPEEKKSITTIRSLVKTAKAVNFYLNYGLCGIFERHPIRDLCIPGNGNSGQIHIPSLAINKSMNGLGVLIQASEEGFKQEYWKVISIRNIVFFDSMLFAKTGSGQLYRHKYTKGALSLHVSDLDFANIRRQIKNT